ncbi:hypothetical protein [Sodalis sp. RH23]|uniref:hypothetical protein n=1 Tax=unclassified Sodalis (in: enterobacteria) TaxID=2636512 RepID=UPI0039B3A44A
MKEKLVKLAYDECSTLVGSQLINCNYASGALFLSLLANNKKIKIAFDWIYCFRVIDEGDLLKMQEEQKGEMVAGIYTILHSPYLKWFNEQSADIHAKEGVVHYSIVTIEDVIDVLSLVPPVISSE